VAHSRAQAQREVDQHNAKSYHTEVPSPPPPLPPLYPTSPPPLQASYLVIPKIPAGSHPTDCEAV